jgi:hypothetical protein
VNWQTTKTDKDLFPEFSITDITSNISLIEGEETERFWSEELESKQTSGDEDDGSITIDFCCSS